MSGISIGAVMAASSVPDSRAAPTIGRIVAAVAEDFEAPLAEVRGRSQKARAVRARRIAMYLAYTLTGLHARDIGRASAGAHQTSVFVAFRDVHSRLCADGALRAKVQVLEQELGPGACPIRLPERPGRQRACLRCGRRFHSSGPHNRLCWSCREPGLPEHYAT